MAPDGRIANAFGDRARAALAAFIGTYPDSMRAQAALVLKNAIPTKN